jgi:hypothetical protein
LSLPFDELEFYGLFLMPELVLSLLTAEEELVYDWVFGLFKLEWWSAYVLLLLASLFEARIYLLEFDWAGKAGAEEESC